MAKKSYISHDSNARNSKKMLRMREKLGPVKGPAAYGIYWMLIERLREEEGYISEKDYGMLAFDFRCDIELIRAVVEDFGLFDFSEDGTAFYSHGLEERMAIMEARSAAGRCGAQGRWGDRNGNRMANNGENENSDGKTDGKTEDLPIAKDDFANGKPDANKINKIKETKVEYNDIDIISTDVLCPTESSDALGKTDDSEKILPDRHCQNIVDFWNRTVSETQSTLPRVLTLSDKRKKKMRTRWKEFKKVGDPVEICRTVFLKACTSNFCQGDNKTGWSADFNWIFENGENWVKVYEGNYDNKPTGGGRASIPAQKDRMQGIVDEYTKLQQALHGRNEQISADSAPDNQG